MTILVTVDFKKSKQSKLALLGSAVPQFFDNDANPIREVNRYLRIVSTRLAYKSLITNVEHLKEFLDWLLNSDITIEDITDDIFDAYIDVLCTYRKSTGEPLSWNTVNARASGAYRFLVWGHNNGYCPDLNLSDARNIKYNSKQKYKAKGHISKPVSTPVSFLQLNDAIRFIDALADVSGKNNPNVRKRNKLIGAFILQTGVRVSEVCNFPLKDLPEINSKGHSTPARVVGKGSKARVILIPNPLLLKLWEYVDLDRERILEEKTDQDVSDNTLFLNAKGKRVSINWIQKLFRKTGKHSGIKSHPHILRHTFATYYYLFNRDLASLSQLLGHASETTTQRYYVHTATLVSYVGSYSGFQQEIDSMIEASFE